MKKEECCNNDFGVASVVLGIVGLVSSIIVVPVIFSILALVFGIIQYKKGKNKWAIWGIALGILGVIVAILVGWKLYAASLEMQALVQNCMANPSTPGCEDILALLGGAP